MASSSKNPLKRFGFKRTNTSDAIATEGKVVHATTTELGVLDGSGIPSKIANEFAGRDKADHSDAVNDLSEVEANRRLSMFREEHNWDPNMPDGAFDAVNDAVRAHDQKGEAILVDELINDSPYPEVCRPGPCNPTLLTDVPGTRCGSQLRRTRAS